MKRKKNEHDYWKTKNKDKQRNLIVLQNIQWILNKDCSFYTRQESDWKKFYLLCLCLSDW